MYKSIKFAMCLLALMLPISTYAGQDPMRPPSWVKQRPVENVKNEAIELQQILISKDRKIVIINNQVLKEGNTIVGMKIIKIEAAQVVLRRAGVNKIIKLLPATKEVKREK